MVYHLTGGILRDVQHRCRRRGRRQADVAAAQIMKHQFPDNYWTVLLTVDPLPAESVPILMQLRSWWL